MNHARSGIVAGIILLSATLAACDGGEASGSAAQASTQDSAPVVSSRGAKLRDASSNTTAASASTTAAALNTNATARSPATMVVRTTTPAATPATEPQSLSLTWSAPEDNVDGSPLVDLSGYKIRYGTSSGHYTQTVTLDNAGLNRFVIDNLPAGTYYFTISAYNSAGTESQLSGEVATTI